MKTKKALSDVSMFEAYMQGVDVKKGTRVICVSDDDFSVIKGSYGISLESATNPYIKWENIDFNKRIMNGDWAVNSFNLAPFPDELYNKLVLGVEDDVKDDVKVLVHLLRCSIEFELTETDTHLAKLLIAKYTPRKQYTLEQLREKIGEDFDIVKH